MKLLLDTHLLLWAAARPDRLSHEALGLIEDPDNEPMFSAASLWEIVIKYALVRPEFNLDPRLLRRELLDNGHEVLLIDKNPRSIKVDSLPRAEWLLADAAEITSLDEAGLERCNVVICATGDDKVNLVVSLLAKTEYGVPRVVARVNHPGNEWLYNESWGVDVAVSTPRLLSALVEEAVSVGDLVRLMTFGQSEASLVELTMPDDAPLVGQRVGGIDWPADTSLVAQVEALTASGMGVKDACAQVITATPGAPSRRELYDAVLRAR